MKVLELILNRIFSFESKNQATRSVLDVLELVHHCIVASIMKAVTVISASQQEIMIAWTSVFICLVERKLFSQISQFQITHGLQLLDLFLEVELTVYRRKPRFLATGESRTQVPEFMKTPLIENSWRTAGDPKTRISVLPRGLAVDSGLSSICLFPGSIWGHHLRE